MEKLQGDDPGPPGEVDYCLARQAVVAEYRNGRLSRQQVCDAHPELMRAARNVGEERKQYRAYYRRNVGS